MDKKNNRPIEETSYQFLFFILGSLCLLVSFWTWGDELFTRRPWKAYQKEYFKEEIKKAEEELAVVTAKITDKRNDLNEEIKSASLDLEGNDELIQLKNDLSKINLELGDTLQTAKFAKSRLDEAYYFYKHALHGGENWEPQKEIVDAIQEEIDSFSPQIVSLKKQRDDFLAQIKPYVEKKKEFEKELISLDSDVERLKLKMGGFKNSLFSFDFYKIPEVLQVVIKGADINNFGEPLLRVDRCMTCHISYDNPEYANFAQPLTTHPNLDVLIKKHPIREFGCTFCHKGQGVAISTVWQAHGHMHHEGDQTIGQNEPLLEGDFRQSNCRMCHDDAAELEYAPVLTKGKQLFIKLGCHGCHLVQGYGKIDKVAPSLKRVASKVNPSWLFRWIKKPKDYLSKTRMPYFGLSDADALAITAYLIDQSDKDYKLKLKFIPTPDSDGEKGRLLFEKLGCRGCHMINGKGGEFAPDLSNIANKTNSDWLYNWVHNSKQYDSKTIMPSFRLSDIEARQLITYLITLGERKDIKELEEKIKSPELIAMGDRLIRRRGCFACHEINGMEREGRIAPELTTFGNKRLLELEFGDSHIEKNWESWARTKLKNPMSFRTERVLDKMPNFALTQDEINSLVVFLKSLNGSKLSDKHRHQSEKTVKLEAGLTLIKKYNCRGCHTIDGKGGRLAPLLNYEGHRAKTQYLFDFLMKPRKIRPKNVFSATMPTFGFSHEEALKLTQYFKTSSGVPFVSELTDIDVPQDDYLIQGRKLVLAFECELCHDKKAPRFSEIRKRLRSSWVKDWLKNTRTVNPRTKMPNHWPIINGKHMVAPKYPQAQKMLDGDVDQQIEAIVAYLYNYNEKPFLDIELPEEEDEDEEDEEDEF